MAACIRPWGEPPRGVRGGSGGAGWSRAGPWAPRDGRILAFGIIPGVSDAFPRMAFVLGAYCRYWRVLAIRSLSQRRFHSALTARDKDSACVDGLSE